MKTFHDGNNEVIEITLRIQKRNFDALVKVEEDGGYVPVNGIAIAFDEAASEPVARLRVNSPDSLKVEQEALGFYGVKVIRGQ